MYQQTTQHRYVIEFYRGVAEGGGPRELLEAAPIEPDWLPALEHARFERVRCDPSSAMLLGLDNGSVEPDWHETLGAPYVRGIHVSLSDATNRPTRCPIPATYFADQAQAAATALVENGRIAKGERFAYLVAAYPFRNGAMPTQPRGFDVESLADPLPIREQPLKGLLSRSVAYGRIEPGDVPAFIPQAVIHEAVEHCEQAGAAETGGVLIGHLRRDGAGSEVYLEATGLIHARHTEQELTRLTFSPETWADVDTVIRLRSRGEMKLGWWHTHPARQWCKDCPIENQRVCKLSGEFFSVHDVALHRAAFSPAYNVALVISDSFATGVTWPLFGWRHGTVQQRGFHILGN